MTPKTAKKKERFYWTSLESRKDGKVKGDEIKIKAEGQTHVWVKDEEDGPIGQANAPYYFRKVTGDFTATVKVSSRMSYWLDQAGLLLRAKKSGVYTKVGMEYHDDPYKPGDFHYYAAAFVHPFSELESINNPTPYPGQWKTKDRKYDYVCLEAENPDKRLDMWYRITRTGKKIAAEYSLDGEDWALLRKKSKFTKNKTISVGVFAASGLGDSAGVKATFTNLSIQEDPDWVDDGEDDSDEIEDLDDPVPIGKQTHLILEMQRRAEEEAKALQEAKESEIMAKFNAVQNEIDNEKPLPPPEDDLVVGFDLRKAIAGGRRSSMIDPATIRQRFTLGGSDSDSGSESGSSSSSSSSSDSESDSESDVSE